MKKKIAKKLFSFFLFFCTLFMNVVCASTQVEMKAKKSSLCTRPLSMTHES
jgi:hypothetical protein